MHMVKPAFSPTWVRKRLGERKGGARWAPPLPLTKSNSLSIIFGAWTVCLDCYRSPVLPSLTLRQRRRGWAAVGLNRASVRMSGNLRMNLDVAVDQNASVEDIRSPTRGELLRTRIGNIRVGVPAADCKRQHPHRFAV